MLPDARPGPSICARAEAVLHAGPMSSPGPATPLDLLGLPLDRLTRFLVDDLAGRPFRARQLYRWIHQRGVTDFDEMTDLSKALRAKLKERCAARARSRRTSSSARSTGPSSTACKTRDGKLIESVYMPSEDRKTLCVSTQVGCAMACTFCMTGTLGLCATSPPAEIVAQVHAVNREVRAQRGSWRRCRPLTNLVFMGMGEPLHNFENLKTALDILQSEEGPNFSHRHITVSTVGLVPDDRAASAPRPT